MSPWEKALVRWVEAGFIDAATASRIRDFEKQSSSGEGLRWPVALALAVGGLLVGAGLLLFVSAHWDELRPAARMAIILALVAVFHAAAAMAADRFAGLSVTLHALGTIALGGGIAMAGQIFNLEEHWRGGALLWAIGASIAWWLLRDWPQLAFTALLVPAWIVGELEFRWGHGAAGVIGVFVLNTAFVYMSARHGWEAGTGRKVLVWLGGIAVIPAVLITTFTVRDHYSWNWTAGPVAWIVALLVPLGAAWALRGREAWMNIVAALWPVVLLPLSRERSDLGVEAWCALGSLGIVAWGLRDQRPERVNLGMACFAITLAFFYFSNIMDKLGRAASLAGLGLLFLAGGWALERTRRALIARVRGPA